MCIRDRSKPAPKAEPVIKDESAERSRPQKKSRAQLRAEARQKDPALAARYARYLDELKLGDEESDILSGEPAVSEFFEAALAVYRNPQSIAKWIMSELLRALKDLSLIHIW